MPAGGSASEEARRKRERAARKRAEADKLERDAKHWELGARGEAIVARVLDGLPDEFVVYHDLQIPDSKANVDHLLIGPGGIWAIDAKLYRNPVTIGKGKGADRIWTARSPIKVETTAWEASVVSDLIGYPVDPVMCITAPSLPKNSFEWDGVRICAPHRLARTFVGNVEPEVDVRAASAAVAVAFDARPADRPAPQAQTAGRAAAAPAAPKHRSSRPLPIRVLAWIVDALEKPVVRLIAGFAGLLLLIQLLPAITGVASSVIQRGAESMIPTVDEPPRVDIEDPPPVDYEVACALFGQWRMHVEWPGPLPDGADAYAVRTERVDGSLVGHNILPWRRPDQSIGGPAFDPGDVTTVLTDLLDSRGRVVATTTETFEGGPPEPCQ